MITLRARQFIIYIVVFAVTATLFTAAWATSQVNSQLAAALIVGLAVGALAFFMQDIAAIAILLSMVLSPEISVASLPSREVVIRFDDIVLIIFFVSWLFKMAYFKNLGLLSVTALNVPILAYILIGIISTLRGAGAGNINVAASMLYLLKYTEYFMIFFMFSNIIKTEEQLKKFLTAFLVAAACACVYGFYEISIGIYRISAPFEGINEPNTYGGYLLLVLGMLTIAALWAPELKIKTAFGAAAVGVAPLIMATYSRASYLGLAMMAPAFIYFAKPSQRTFMIVALIVAVAISPFVMPKRVKDRIMAPFSGPTEEVAPLVRLNKFDSSYEKVKSAKIVLGKWSEDPIFGKGITGVGLVDAQYPRILGEMGIFGVIAFLWIIGSIFVTIRRAFIYLKRFKGHEEWLWKVVTAGYACSCVGIFMHGFGANTFIIVRIMEPFWFLTAVVAALPAVIENKRGPTQELTYEKLTYQIYHTGHEDY
jgi:hypothetical protein